MAMSTKIVTMARELADAARVDDGQYVIIVVKGKEGKLSKDDLHAEVGMDAGTLLSVICTLIQTIVKNTGYPAKEILRDVKDLMKRGEKKMKERGLW